MVERESNKMESSGENGSTKGKHGSRVLDPIRKKILMKKLEKIKLNRSRNNNSIIDVSSFYESKVRKLKSNNTSLAKALAEQRLLSQSWYDEVVSMKVKHHETREELLRYQVNETSSFESAIKSVAEKRIREIAEPLETAITESFQNVASLVESMTKVKKILSSLLKSSSEGMNYSRTSSRGSTGSRPPLSHTPKSPRKNVVHPMVEGHVLQPASIHIPRMSLEERRKYRLQERAEAREDLGMSVIGEASHSMGEDGEESSPIEEASESLDLPPAVALFHDADSPLSTTPEPSTEQEEFPIVSVTSGVVIRSDSPEDELSDLTPEPPTDLTPTPSVQGDCSQSSKDNCSPSTKNNCSPSTKNNCSPSTKNNCSPSSKENCSTSLKAKCSPLSKDNCSSSKRKCSPPSKDNCSSSSKRKCSPPSKDNCSPSSKGKCSPPKYNCSPSVKEKLSPSDRETHLPEIPSTSKNSDEERTSSPAIEAPVDKKTRPKSTIDTEDPLEGSSWMHTKRRGGSKKRKKKSEPALKRTSGMHILLDSSSDSDEEIIPKTPKPYKGRGSPVVKGKSKIGSKETKTATSKLKNNSITKVNGTSQDIQKRVQNVKKDTSKDEEEKSARSEPPSSDLNSSFPELSLSRLEELEKRISRRSQKQSRCLSIVSGKFSETGNDIGNPEVVRSASHDGEPNDIGFPQSPFRSSGDAESSLEANNQAFLSDSITLTSPCNLNIFPKNHIKKENLDVTCLSNSSMEITKCLTEALKGSPIKSNSKGFSPMKEPSPIAKEDSKELSSQEDKKKSNRFFKGFSKEVPKEPPVHERTPYDLSMLEASVLGSYPLTKGKENIPPENETNSQCGEQEEMKLRVVSVVVEDIMKTAPERSPDKMESDEHTLAPPKDTSVIPVRPPSKRKKRPPFRIGESPVKKSNKRVKKSITMPDQPVSNIDLTETEVIEDERKPKRTSKKKIVDIVQNDSSSSDCKLITHRKKRSSPGVPAKNLNDCDDFSNPIANGFPHFEEAPSSFQDENDDILDEIYQDLTSLLQIDINVGKEIQPEELDPLALSPECKRHLESDDDIEVIDVIDSDYSDDGPKMKFNVNSLVEGVKARPRRAARKILSFKEPSLNVKLRQDNGKKITGKQKRNSKRSC